MKKDFQQFIAECIQEVIAERHESDPTKEEMVAFLKKQFGSEGSDFDIEEAIFWFAANYHGGQSSNLYSAGSTSAFRPGPMANGPEQDGMGELMYQALVDMYGDSELKSGEATEEPDSLPSTKDRIEPQWGVSETSQLEPYDSETDTFQPSPRERTDEVPPKEWMYDPKYIGDTIEQIYGRQPSLQDIMEYFALKYGQQAHSKLVKKVIDRFTERNPNFYIVLPRDQSAHSLKEGMVETAAVARPERLEKKEARAIGTAFAKLGLDGNGRFEKKEHGLHAITRALDTLGFQLDMVTADIIMGDKGQRNLTFRRKNDEGADPFTEKPEIINSRIAFIWENLAREGQTPRYEILAYATQ